jgi:hypothetical protein
MADPIRREGWRIEGFLAAGSEASRCWAGIVVHKSLSVSWGR